MTDFKFTLTRRDQVASLKEFLAGDDFVLWSAFCWQDHPFRHEFWSAVTQGKATPYQRKKARREARRLIAEFGACAAWRHS